MIKTCQTGEIHGYASNEGLENVKDDLMSKLADLREEMKMGASVTYEERSSNTLSADHGLLQTKMAAVHQTPENLSSPVLILVNDIFIYSGE